MLHIRAEINDLFCWVSFLIFKRLVNIEQKQEVDFSGVLFFLLLISVLLSSMENGEWFNMDPMGGRRGQVIEQLVGRYLMNDINLTAAKDVKV